MNGLRPWAPGGASGDTRSASRGRLPLSLAEDLDASERRRESLEAKTRQVVDTAIRRIDQRLQADAELAQQIDP